MNFETKEGNECIVRNYRDLQVIVMPLYVRQFRHFLFLRIVQQFCSGQHQSEDSRDSVRKIALPCHWLVLTVSLAYRQKTIAILDLEKPDGPQPVRKLGRQSKFDIRVLEWNHSEENRNLLASTVSDMCICMYLCRHVDGIMNHRICVCISICIEDGQFANLLSLKEENKILVENSIM